LRFITVSELRQQATKVVAGIVDTKEDVIVTRNGKPVVHMRFTHDDEFSISEPKKSKKKGGGKRG